MYVELPNEEKFHGEDVCGRLRLSLYGTRPAASNWEETYSTYLEEIEFLKGKASACCFHHPKRDIKSMVHGDDFVTVGRLSHLEWMRNLLQTKFEVKWEILGPCQEHKKEIKVLNRSIRWTDRGIIYEADPRHAQKMIEQMSLTAANGVRNPAYRKGKEEKDSE